MAEARDGDAATAAITPATSLSAMDAQTSVSGAGGTSSPPTRNGRRSSSAVASAEAPSGLCAPSSRTSRRPRPGTVTSTSSSRPGQRAVAYPTRLAAGGTAAIPAASRASRSASAVAALAAWWRPRSPTTVGPRRGRSTVSASRVQPSTGAGDATASGTSSRPQRRRMIASASPVAPVTARSPRMTMAAFSRAIAVTVGPSHSIWSRPTLVTTATPPSQAWVASRRPPIPTSTSATSGRVSAKCRNMIAVSSSNSVGGPRRRAMTSASGSTSDTRQANASGAIGRPSTTIRSR